MSSYFFGIDLGNQVCTKSRIRVLYKRLVILVYPIFYGYFLVECKESYKKSDDHEDGNTSPDYGVKTLAQMLHLLPLNVDIKRKTVLLIV